MKSGIALALAVLWILPVTETAENVELTFKPIGHSTFVILSPHGTIYVDPVGDPSAFDGLPAPDAILISDIHADHLDPDVVSKLAAKETIIIAPKAVADQLMAGASVLNNGESTKVGTIEITAIPMYNLTEDRLMFHEKGRGNGYVVTIGEQRIYISGDTEDIPEMRSLKDIDFAFVCMNLPYTMTVEQAASAVLEFKPAVVIPYHYRGKGGLSDISKFKQLVSTDENIEVRLMNWYE